MTDLSLDKIVAVLELSKQMACQSSVPTRNGVIIVTSQRAAEGLIPQLLAREGWTIVVDDSLETRGHAPSHIIFDEILAAKGILDSATKKIINGVQENDSKIPYWRRFERRQKTR